jgi:hypothetical protein
MCLQVVHTHAADGCVGVARCADRQGGTRRSPPGGGRGVHSGARSRARARACAAWRGHEGVWFIPAPVGVALKAWKLLAIFLGTIVGIITTVRSPALSPLPACVCTYHHACTTFCTPPMCACVRLTSSVSLCLTASAAGRHRGAGPGRGHGDGRAALLCRLLRLLVRDPLVRLPPTASTASSQRHPASNTSTERALTRSPASWDPRCAG